jgi:predicted enzyme related to lactoylglutathione lyase
LSSIHRATYLLCEQAVENVAPLPRSFKRRQEGKKVMSNADPRGQFVWHELWTSDAGAATSFYTKVVPWKTQSWDQDSSYSMWVAKNGPVGGIASLGDVPAPKWLAYIGVDDVAATVEAAKGLGARIVKGATEIPNMGVYALLADPQGAEFGIYKSNQPSNGASGGGAGEFTWHELATSDAKAAMEFYTKLFGWEVGPVHDMGGPAGNYHLFLRGGNQYGGMYTNTDAGGPNWLCYIGVEDAGKAANAVKSAGGRLLNGPMEVPGGSWVAMALDVEGVPFAVHEPAKTAASKPAEAPGAKPKSSVTKPPKAAKASKAGGAASSITKPPQATGGGAASSITKPPQASGGGAASSITKPPQATGGGAASSVTKPPKRKSSITKPPKKSAAKKAKKKAPAKKAGKKAAKGKAVAKKAAGKKKSAAKRAPAKKKASRAKAKKRR